MNIELLDSIYERYGYEVKKSHVGVRVYIFTKSIYSGAEIIVTDSQSCNIEQLRKEYSDSGYAVKVRQYKSIEEAEVILFKEFFKVDAVIQNLKRRYEDFIRRVMDKLSDSATYEYIKCPYEISKYQSENENFENTSVKFYQEGLVERLSDLLDSHQGPLFVILEAAAGYGKTCTAYELLSHFLKISNTKIPFFTELSRDRKATIFSHILRKEIEEQFANRVDSSVVIGEIKKGRIPLIIDGFDELISKDFSFNTSEFQQVESMLSTVVDLLSDNAKIVITSRKTAIFNSEDFYNWMSNRNIDYTMAKITISEPCIENWLNKEQLDVINRANLPLETFANPVLLAFLKYSSMDELEKMVLKDNTIINEYLDFLLKREQTRQGLLIEPETQLRIFRKLVRLFTELDIKTASKDDIKELILDYNKKILSKTLEKYLPSERPRIEQLADTLSNHAFLDKKDNKTIGFVNEFIFGTLIAQNLVMGKYMEHNSKFYKDLDIMFANLAFHAYRVQTDSEKHKLWEVFTSLPFNYDPLFYLQIDVELEKSLNRKYKQLAIDNYCMSNISFIGIDRFENTVFTNCAFKSCEFNTNSFRNCSFVKCKFYDCIVHNKKENNNYIGFFTSTDNNGFIEKMTISDDEILENEIEEISSEKLILDKFFNQGSLRPRYRQFSQLNSELSDMGSRELSKQLHSLEVKNYIAMNGNLCHLTKEGIIYYNEQYRKS